MELPFALAHKSVVLLVVFFVQSGRNGFVRNLTSSEIVQQIIMLVEEVNRIELYSWVWESHCLIITT